MTLSVNDFGEELSLSAKVHRSLDARQTCGYMHRALEELVEALERAPKSSLDELRVLPETERHQMLVEWNATETAYPSDRCIHELFEEQVALAPDAVAVLLGDAQLTYVSSMRSANQLSALSSDWVSNRASALCCASSAALPWWWVCWRY